MNGQAILTVSAAVVGLTQLIKLLFGIDREDVRGAVVLGCSLAGVALWGFSQGDVNRASIFAYFAGWITVSTSAAGVFGLVVTGQRIAAARSGSTGAVSLEAVQKQIAKDAAPPPRDA
jgi:hypothetical protein